MASDDFNVTLKVDGEDLPLNPFLQEFLGHTVFGMIRSLKGVKEEKVQALEIRIEKKQPEKETESLVLLRIRGFGLILLNRIDRILELRKHWLDKCGTL